MSDQPPVTIKHNVFMPTNTLRHAADGIMELLNSIIDENGTKVPYPTYVSREYVLDMLGSIIKGLIEIGSSERRLVSPDAKQAVMKQDFMDKIKLQ